MDTARVRRAAKQGAIMSGTAAVTAILHDTPYLVSFTDDPDIESPGQARVGPAKKSEKYTHKVIDPIPPGPGVA